MIPLLFLLATALAGDVHVVRDGETLESIAESEATPGGAHAIRELNRVGPEEQAPVGTVLQLPDAGGENQDAFLLNFSGSGRIQRPSSTEQEPLTNFARLPPGTTICTDAGSFASVRLAVSQASHDHDDVSLLPGTCLTVLTAHAHGGRRTSLVALGSGSVSVTSADDADTAVIVQTESGLARGEDGGFRVTKEDSAMRTEALFGSVSTMGQGREVRVPMGFGGRVRTGEAPDQPVQLLGRSTPISPDDGAPLRVPSFSWRSVEDALGYYLELADSPDFAVLVAREQVASTSWEPSHLVLPYRGRGLWWRITSIDRAGFEGLPSKPRSLSLPLGVGP